MNNNWYITHDFQAHLLYLIKCLIGVSICYILFVKIPQYPFYWAMISVVIVFSPDNRNQLAYDRMKANLLGCVVGLCLYPLHLPDLLLLCIGIAVTVFLGVTFKITNTLRSALGALVIVTMHEQHFKQWYIPFERAGCVVTGCLIALVITLLFNFSTRRLKKKKNKFY